MSNSIGFNGSLFTTARISAGSSLNIDNNVVITASGLGSNIVSSSLSSLGILDTLEVAGNTKTNSLDVTNDIVAGAIDVDDLEKVKKLLPTQGMLSWIKGEEKVTRDLGSTTSEPTLFHRHSYVLCITILIPPSHYVHSRPSA